MKRLSTFAGLALAGSVLVAVPTLRPWRPDQPQRCEPTMVQQISSDRQRHRVVRADKATGKATLRARRVRRMTCSPAWRLEQGAAGAKADAFLARFGPRSARPPASSCATPSSTTARLHRQLPPALPGRAGLRPASSRQRRPRRRPGGGQWLRGPRTWTSPSRRRSPEAAARAVALVRNDPPVSEKGTKVDTRGLKAVSNDLAVYRTGFAPRHRRAPLAGAPDRGDQPQEHPRHGLHRCQRGQGGQPLLD